MQDGDGRARETAKLRLASARRRAHFFLREILTLESSDFPHPDAEEALSVIKRHFIDLLKDSDGLEDASFKVIKEVNLNIGMALDSYTPVLGVILRSTSVRNAFELHYPLRRLVEQIIGQHARLVISSEWDFIPFTYPMNLDVLPSHVIVGGPATESSNALIVPLAGHEIGHSAWQHHHVTQRLEDSFAEAIVAVLARDPDAKNHLEQEYGSGFFEGLLRDTGFRLIEEIFCDCFALFVFGDAYAFAFEYFMFPGGSTRSYDYPPEEHRVRYMKMAASWKGFALAEGTFDGWSGSPDDPGGDDDVTAILDKAIEIILPDVFSSVDTVLSEAQVRLPDPLVVGSVLESFNKGVPHNGRARLSEIVIAGWHKIRSEGGWSDPDTIEKAVTLNEVILKTVEVSEYRHRTSAC